MVVRVWDPLVRVLHWSLVLAVSLSWLGTFAIAGVHQGAGYVALAIVLLRLLWGAIGSHYARFAQFVRGPRATWVYLKAVLQRREPRYLGHNPLGTCMVLALLADVAGLAGPSQDQHFFWAGDGPDLLGLRVFAVFCAGRNVYMK